eukprot:890954-Pelagomonas_calceolata.AAC.4
MAGAACMARTQLCMHACALHINATSVSGKTGFANLAAMLATLPSLVKLLYGGAMQFLHTRPGRAPGQVPIQNFSSANSAILLRSKSGRCRKAAG